MANLIAYFRAFGNVRSKNGAWSIAAGKAKKFVLMYKTSKKLTNSILNWRVESVNNCRASSEFFAVYIFEQTAERLKTLQ
jgi:hypothetical protein